MIESMEEYRNINGVLVSNMGNTKNGTHEHGDYLEIDNGNHDHIHVLVAKAFPEICGEWFDGCVVHHIDHNKHNNAATNLIVLSRKEHFEKHREDFYAAIKKRKNNNPNNEMFYKIANIKALNGTNHNGKWRNIKQYTKDGVFVAEYGSVYEASTINKISPTVLRRALNGKVKTAGGFKWVS